MCVSELCVCECGAGGGREEGEEEAVRTEVRNQKRELHKDVGKDTKQVKRASYRAVVLRRNTHSAMFVHSRCLQANQHV